MGMKVRLLARPRRDDAATASRGGGPNTDFYGGPPERSRAHAKEPGWGRADNRFEETADFDADIQHLQLIS